ncbi:MAG: hypothetical protein JNK05_19165 [Myxococcales bacterium]|nr:hypothetical protein [Myxococcales bacterium]
MADGVRAAWIDPRSNAIVCVVGATATTTERIVCESLGIDQPLRAWDETISWVGFVPGPTLRVVAVCCNREEKSRVMLTRGEALDAPIELGRSSAKTRVHVRCTRDGERIVVAGLGSKLFDRDGTKTRESSQYLGSGARHALLSADAQVWVHAEQLQLEDASGARVRSWRVNGSKSQQAELVALSARAWLTLETLGGRRARRWSVDAHEPAELTRLPARVNSLVDGANQWFAARASGELVFCASDDGAEIAAFPDATLLAMNDDSAAIVQRGRARVVHRESAASDDSVEDFTTIDALFVSDRGAVVAQDQLGTLRFWSEDAGELVAEHRSATDRGTLLGLGRGGTVAVCDVRDDGRLRALRCVVARDGFAHEIESPSLEREGALPATQVAGFRDDLDQWLVVREAEGARSIELIERGRVVVDERLEPNRSTVSATVDPSRLVVVDGATMRVFEQAGGSWLRRARASLSPAGSRCAAHWGALSYGDTEDKINAVATRLDARAEALAATTTTVVLSSRSRQRPAVAERAEFVAWVRFDRQAIAIKRIGDDKPTWIEAVERGSIDEVVAIALSPTAAWFAVALQSGIVRRFQRA